MKLLRYEKNYRFLSNIRRISVIWFEIPCKVVFKLISMKRIFELTSITFIKLDIDTSNQEN